MEFTQHVRKPFFVEAIKITNENIAELAEFIGTLEQKPNGKPYIQVGYVKVKGRRVPMVPNVFQVTPGYWMTKMGNNIRCYAGHVFEKEFTEVTPEIVQWVDFLNDKSPDPDEEVDVAPAEA